MTFVKICGITNLEDALSAVAAGADALGFNFYRPSPRYIEPSAAREIVDKLPAQILTVGVFVNEPDPAEVERVSTEAGIAAAQLHGDESPEFCNALKDRYVIKVLCPGVEFDPQNALQYNVKAIMLDAFDKQLRGGTGKRIDWLQARRVREILPRLFLAGGLSPENVREAITAVEPYAVDACSALEIVPGKKDPMRVRAFVEAAHEK